MGPLAHPAIGRAAVFKDPKSGLTRRTLSVSPDALVEIDVHNSLPRKTTGHFPAHATGTRGDIVVLAGKVDVTVGKREFKLATGDAAQFSADVEHSIHNPGPKRAEWLLVIHRHREPRNGSFFGIALPITRSMP